MKTHIRPTLAAILLASTAGLFTGCSTVNLDDSGDTQAVYELGQFEMLVNSNAPSTYAATQKALQSLDLYQTKAELNTYDAQISARARNDQKISIDIKEVNSRQTMVKIRWGTTGSKANSRALFEAIDHNLH